MSGAASDASHGPITKILHWGSAVLLGYGYLKDLDDVQQLADAALLRSEIAFAAGVGVLFALRFAWTHAVAGATRLPPQAPRWEHRASRLVHLGLYAAVFGIVLTGLGIGLGYSIPLLGGLFLTAMLGLHEVALGLFPILLVLHVGGALWHRLIRRDGVLASMTSPRLG